MCVWGGGGGGGVFERVKFKRLLQTRGPYKITSNIKKKTLCKYYQYQREINYIEIE